MRTVLRGLLLVLVCLIGPTNLSAQDATSDTGTYELSVAARLCGAADEIGNRCGPMDGVAITVTDQNDAYLGECVTAPYDGAGSTCTISVPLGSTVTASVSADSIPANHTLSVKNRTITVPSDPNESNQYPPTFEYWDDTLLEQTVVPEESTDEVGTEASGEIESGGQTTETEPAQSTDTGVSTSNPTAQSQSQLDRILDDWAVIAVLGIGIVAVLAISVSLVRSGKKRS